MYRVDIVRLQYAGRELLGSLLLPTAPRLRWARVGSLVKLSLSGL